MSELKACPFCGERGIHMPVVFADVDHVACSNRDCYMCRSEVPVDEWNHRPIEDAEREDMDAGVSIIQSALGKYGPTHGARPTAGELCEGIAVLRAENAHLREELAEAKKSYAWLDGHLVQVVRDNGGRIEQLESALNTYGRHHDSCDSRNRHGWGNESWFGKCTCGLDAAKEERDEMRNS